MHNFCTTLYPLQPLFLCEKGTIVHKVPENNLYEHCHVAKALFTVASVNAIVLLTLL